MLQSAKIKIRSLKELQAENLEYTDVNVKTPFKKRKKPSPTSATIKQFKQDDDNSESVLAKKAPTRTTNKLYKSALKELPPSQKRIDSFFKSCQKNYKIETFQVEPPTPIVKRNTKQQKTTPKTKKKCATTKKTTDSTQKRYKTGRKRLFADPEISTETLNSNDSTQELIQAKMIECITIDSDDDDEPNIRNSPLVNSEARKTTNLNITPTLNELSTTQFNDSLTTPKNFANDRCSSTTKTTSKPSTKTSLKQEKTTPRNRSLLSNENSSVKRSVNYQQFTTNDGSKAFVDKENSSKNVSLTPSNSALGQPNSQSSSRKKQTHSQSSSSFGTNTVTKRKSKPCPPYKIIEGTTFAVDAFQFGYIENVSHYFLTHFHADHYIGLTRTFSMPLYMSHMTARFVRAFIPIDERHINELELNKPHIIDNIEITALDANHCPGAVLLVFKFLDSGKCILHTGDFRAWHGMESEPIFWNNDIHTIYLDTTYISDKYNFCQQYESIEKAKNLIETFKEKHQGKRILYICGSYVIGKEKFWSSLANHYNLKVWAEGSRNKALKSMEDEHLDRLLIDDPFQANMHIIPMVKLSYLHLVDYFSQYEDHYDIVFAIRPSGWEKKFKPQYRGKINIIGIEYSEHSSFSEMQRFVKFLKPQQVLSTVPTGTDLMVTAEIPQLWYKYDTLKSSANYQPSIDTYFPQTPLKKNIRSTNLSIGGLETFVSPLSLGNTGKQNQSNIKNDDMQQVLSINSSENEFQPEIAAVKQKPKTSKQPEKCTKNLRENKSVLNGKKNKIKRKVSAHVLQRENQDLGISLENSKLCSKAVATKQEKIFQKNLKKTSHLEQSIKNSVNQANIGKQKNTDSANEISISLVSKSSSEDFEMPDILSTVKKKPFNTNAKSNLEIITEDDLATGSNTKKKLLFEKSNTKLPENSATSKVAKFKNLKQTTTTSSEDFENSQPQSSKRLNLRASNQINNLPYAKQEIQDSVTTSSDNDTEIPITQKQKVISSNKKTKNPEKHKKTNSLTNSTDEEMVLRVSQRVRRKNQNLSTTTITTAQQLEQEKQFGETLMQLSKQPQKSTKISRTPTSQQQSFNNKSQINPLLKSNTTSTCSSVSDEIPQTQTKKQHPRPLRTKRNGLTQSSPTATPIKKSKNQLRSRVEQKELKISSDSLLSSDETITNQHTLKNNQKSKNGHSAKDKQQQPSFFDNSKTLFEEILYNAKDIDIYNSSQMATLVEKSLSKRCLDTSTDHIPSELLSIPDADDDWMD